MNVFFCLLVIAGRLPVGGSSISFRSRPESWDWLGLKPCPSKNSSLVSPPSKCSNVQTPNDGVYYSIERFSESKLSYATAVAATGISKTTTAVIGLIGKDDEIYLIHLNIVDPANGNSKSKIVYRSLNRESLRRENVHEADVPSFLLERENLVGDGTLRFWVSLHSYIIHVGLGHSVGMESSIRMRFTHRGIGQNVESSAVESFRISRVSIMSTGASIKWSLCTVEYRINIQNYLESADDTPTLFRLSEKGLEERHRALSRGENILWGNPGDAWRVRSGEKRRLISQFVTLPSSGGALQLYSIHECLTLPADQFELVMKFGCKRGRFEFRRGKVTDTTMRYGQSVETKLNITLEQAYFGHTFPAEYTRTSFCPHCHGTGGVNKSSLEVCSVCGGKGSVVHRDQLQQHSHQCSSHSHSKQGFHSETSTLVFEQHQHLSCDRCQGRGEVVKPGGACTVCHGSGVVTETKETQILLPRGTPNEYKIVLDGEGHENHNLKPGNLVLVVTVLNHRQFVRVKNDLELAINMTIKEALNGFQRTLRHLNGSEAIMVRKGISAPGLRLRVVGAGMPIVNKIDKFGDLVLLLSIQLPESILKHKLNVFGEVMTGNPQEKRVIPHETSNPTAQTVFTWVGN